MLSDFVTASCTGSEFWDAQKVLKYLVEGDYFKADCSDSSAKVIHHLSENIARLDAPWDGWMDVLALNLSVSVARWISTFSVRD